MKIVFSDLGIQHRALKKEIAAGIKGVIRRSDFILGEDVRLFEEEFAGFCGSRYAVGVNSGTGALFLALLALGIGPRDEVVVPAFTYIATANAVSYTGAKPVFADIDEKTYDIDLCSLEKAVTQKTKAVIPVHLYVLPAQMERILEFAAQRNLKVVEDAAQAHGASVKFSGGNRRVTGSMGDAGCFSFYPSKNLGALGDGGMITVNDESLCKKIAMLRNYGRVSKYEHAILGYNARLDTLQAAMLRPKLRRLKEWNQMRAEAAGLYSRFLSSVSGVVTPYAPAGYKHVYHVYSIRCRQRDQLRDALKKKGIETIIHYPIPVHLQGTYKDLGYRKGDFPVSEKIAGEILSLPIFPYIRPAQVKYVAEAIKGALR